MESLEEIIAKYKLSEEEHTRIGEKIKNIFLFDKYPVKNPKAIINIAPPASGKTGLNSYSQNEFSDNNVVIINGDELRPFHPKIDEIAKLYPKYYAKVTDQENQTWTSDLLETTIRENYNIIFEGTGRNTRILNTIQEKMKNYDVVVRGMAVNELNCLISILKRYEYQIEKKGWGRMVPFEHFCTTYKEMPNTIDTIEKSGIVNEVEVYIRGEVPSTPIKIYSSKDKRELNAKQAVLLGRKKDEKNANKYIEQQMQEILQIVSKKEITEDEKKILKRIQELHKQFKEKENHLEH